MFWTSAVILWNAFMYTRLCVKCVGVAEFCTRLPAWQPVIDVDGNSYQTTLYALEGVLSINRLSRRFYFYVAAAVSVLDVFEQRNWPRWMTSCNPAWQRTYSYSTTCMQYFMAHLPNQCWRFHGRARQNVLTRMVPAAECLQHFGLSSWFQLIGLPFFLCI